MEAERTVDAPMDVVWRRLRDYRAGRARMLTEQFAGYAVLLTPGGEGERTLVRVEAVLRDPAGWRALGRAGRCGACTSACSRGSTGNSPTGGDPIGRSRRA